MASRWTSANSAESTTLGALCGRNRDAPGLRRGIGAASQPLHLTGPALRFFETPRSLQPARQVNAVVSAGKPMAPEVRIDKGYVGRSAAVAGLCLAAAGGLIL